MALVRINASGAARAFDRMMAAKLGQRRAARAYHRARGSVAASRLRAYVRAAARAESAEVVYQRELAALARVGIPPGAVL